MTDEEKMNHMIALSQINLKEPSYDQWFTRGHQKLHIFNLAAKLFVEFELSAEDSITRAEDFINEFYRIKVDPKTRR